MDIFGYLALPPGGAPATDLLRVASRAIWDYDGWCGAAGSGRKRPRVNRAAGPFCLHGEVASSLAGGPCVIGAGGDAGEPVQPAARGDVAAVAIGLDAGDLLGALVGARGDAVARVRGALADFGRHAEHAVLAIVGGEMVVSCRGVSLYYQPLHRGVYLASVRFDRVLHYPVPESVRPASSLAARAR